MPEVTAEIPATIPPIEDIIKQLSDAVFERRRNRRFWLIFEKEGHLRLSGSYEVGDGEIESARANWHMEGSIDRSIIMPALEKLVKIGKAQITKRNASVFINTYGRDQNGDYNENDRRSYDYCIRLKLAEGKAKFSVSERVPE